MKLLKLIKDLPLVIKLLYLGAALGLIFWMLLTLITLIPNSLIENQVRYSARVLAVEGDYYRTYTGHKADNFTVAIMISEAWGGDSSESPFVASLENKNYGGESPVQSLYEKLGSSKEGGYPRYWHGYLILIKPLLIFFNIFEIRIIFQLLMLVAIVILSYFLISNLKQVGVVTSLAIVISYGLFDILSDAAVLPMFFSLFISLVASIYFVNCKDFKFQNILLTFFLIGSITVYFDFLDNPMLTLAVPLTVLVMRLFYENVYKKEDSCLNTNSSLEEVDMNLNNNSKRDEISFQTARSAICALFLISIAWLFGYLYLWAIKWLIASLVLGINVFESSLDAAMFRVGAQDSTPLVQLAWEAIVKNVTSMKEKYIASLALMLIAIIVLLVLNSVKYYKMCRISGEKLLHCRSNGCIPFALAMLYIAILPFVWYATLSNHSLIHFDFISFRNQTATVIALSLCIYVLLNELISGKSLDLSSRVKAVFKRDRKT